MKAWWSRGICLLVIGYALGVGCTEPSSDRNEGGTSTSGPERDVSGADTQSDGGGSMSGGDTSSMRGDVTPTDSSSLATDTGRDTSIDTVGGGDGTVRDGGDASRRDSSDGGRSIQVDLTLQTAFGTGLSGASVTYGNQTTSTDSQGRVSLSIRPEAPYTFRIQKQGLFEHRIIGRAGSMDFRYISFTASRASARQFFGRAGITLDSSKGLLVVAVDTPQLQPATGASVSISSSHDSALTIQGASLSRDNTIDPNDRGFVAFPNVETGMTDITVTPPQGETCDIYPGGPPRPDIDIQADTVTVVPFTCQ